MGRIASRLHQAWRELCGIHVPPTPILVSSVPKAGTHLLKNIILAIPGTRFVADIGWLTQRETHEERVAMIEKAMSDSQPADVFTAHTPHHASIAEFLVRRGVRHVFIYRDPRDVAVSLHHYVMRSQGHAYYPMFAAQGSDENRLMATIQGIGEGRVSGRLSASSYPNIRVYCEWYLRWLDDPNTFSLRYEDLVGDRGGSASDEASRVVGEMLRYLGVFGRGTHRGMVARVLDQGSDPGKSPTYRQGRTGCWREEFEPEHIAAFKEVAGDLLVRLGYETSTDWEVAETCGSAIAQRVDAGA